MGNGQRICVYKREKKASLGCFIYVIWKMQDNNAYVSYITGNGNLYVKFLWSRIDYSFLAF